MKQPNEIKLLHSAASYCSICERCISDVSKKLVAAGAAPEMEKRIIERLVKEDFVNESRFSRSFANDKFRFNRWGRIRIRYELQRKRIPEELISAALDEIDEEAYQASLSDLLKDRKRTVKGNSERDVFCKLYRFAVGRGFESQLVVGNLKPLFKGDYAADVYE
ncbi:MAG: RecX family transcriptional regulator [Tannerella sp.]|jgi:regulatory protein|nr:RecX family transcriptional regulator [Tannerella sp.]